MLADPTWYRFKSSEAEEGKTVIVLILQKEARGGGGRILQLESGVSRQAVPITPHF